MTLNLTKPASEHTSEERQERGGSPEAQMTYKLFATTLIELSGLTRIDSVPCGSGYMQWFDGPADLDIYALERNGLYLKKC